MLIHGISEEGQLEPVVLDDEGRVLDGRGRLAACAALGIEPQTTVYGGTNADRYSAEVNLRRRHLTKGQTAMLMVKLGISIRNPEGFQNEISEFQLEISGEQLQVAALSPSRISMAKTVAQYASDLVDPVIAGAITMHDAWNTARERKVEAERSGPRLDALKVKDPSLADRVVLGDLPLADAEKAVANRKKRHIQERKRVTEQLCDLVPALAQHQGGEEFLLFDKEWEVDGREISRAVIAKAITALTEMDAVWQERSWA